MSLGCYRRPLGIALSIIVKRYKSTKIIDTTKKKM